MIKQRLEELHTREKLLVESIRKTMKEREHRCQITYLPNLILKSKVDYVFIAMEPSLQRWAKNEQDAEEKVQEGFRNFILTWEDFILHYCIRKYLSPAYYVTDISKAAMKVKDASYCRREIYPKWYDLLEEEISIVGTEECRLILVGKTVEEFFRFRPLSIKPLRTILHYSGQAAKQRDDYARRHFSEFRNFLETSDISSKRILDFADDLLEENNIPNKIRDWILERLTRSKTMLSESRKKLAFSYYRDFKQC